MDPWIFPVTIIATLILAVCVGWWRRLYNMEKELGDQPKEAYIAYLVWFGGGGVAYYYLIDHWFWGMVIYAITGMFIGGSLVFAATHWRVILRALLDPQ